MAEATKWLFICRKLNLMFHCDTEQEADAQYDLHIIKSNCSGPHLSVHDGGDNPRSWEVFEFSVKEDLKGMENAQRED